MSDPKARYLYQLNKFSEAMKKSVAEHATTPKSSLGAISHKHDGRTPLFQLQALARLDRKISNHSEIAENWLAEFKALEDMFGQYDHWNTMVENNTRWKLPNDLGQYFIHLRFSLSHKLELLLTTQGWITGTPGHWAPSTAAVNRFENDAKDAAWHKPRKEQQKLLEFLRDEVLKIHKAIESRKIDLQELESGIHEFRRKLRWILIYASALRGKISLGKPAPSDALNQYVTEERMKIPFNQLPINSDEAPVVSFLPGGLYALGELIKKISDIKDPGLCTEEVTRIGDFYGLDPELIRRSLGADHSHHADTVTAVQSAVDRYILKEKILVHIGDYFDKQIR